MNFFAFFFIKFKKRNIRDISDLKVFRNFLDKHQKITSSLQLIFRNSCNLN